MSDDQQQGSTDPIGSNSNGDRGGQNGEAAASAGNWQQLFGHGQGLQKNTLFGKSAPPPVELDTSVAVDAMEHNGNGTTEEKKQKEEDNTQNEAVVAGDEVEQQPADEESSTRGNDWFEEGRQAEEKAEPKQSNSDEVVPATQDIVPATQYEHVQQEELQELNAADVDEDEVKALLEQEPSAQDSSMDEDDEAETPLIVEEPEDEEAQQDEGGKKEEAARDEKAEHKEDAELEKQVEDVEMKDEEADKTAIEIEEKKETPKEDEEAASSSPRTPRRSTRGAASTVTSTTSTPATEKKSTLRGTPKTATPVSARKNATPASTPAQTRKQKDATSSVTPVKDAQDKEDKEKTAEAEAEEEQAATPRQTRRSAAATAGKVEQKATPKATPSKEKAKESPSKSIRSTRSGAKAEDTPTSIAVNTSAQAKKTPATGKRGQAAKEGKEVAKEKEETPQTSVKKSASSSKKTPKGKAAEKEENGKAASSKDNGDDDPYNFSQSFDQHPEMLKNIQCEVKSFNEVKFAKVGSSAKYEATEKAAEQRVANLGDLMPKPKQNASLSDLTPGKRKSNVSTTSSIKRSKSATVRDSSEGPESIAEEDDTPRRGRKKKSHANEEAVGGTSAVKRSRTAEELQPPTLNAEEQWSIDHPGDEHAPHEPGARVFALYGKVYYPAIVVASRDGLGRFKVYFLEDRIVKDAPAASVIPLRALVADKTCLAVIEGDDMPQAVRILACPNAASAVDWESGSFEVVAVTDEEDEEAEPKEVNWTALTLDMHEWRDYIKIKSQEMTSILSENISTTEERHKRGTRKSLNESILAGTLPVGSGQKTATPRLSASAKKTPAIAKRDTPSASTTPVTAATGKGQTASGATGSRKRGRRSKKDSEEMDVDNESGSQKEEEETAEGEPSAKKPHLQVHQRSSPLKQQSQEKIFAGKIFILTSAMRTTPASDPSAANSFKKKAMTEYIIENGGIVTDDFADFSKYPSHEGYLISDMHYRTHKYLTALAKAVPCVSHKWINACKEQKKLLDHTPYLLNAGVSIVDGQTYPLPAPETRGRLLAGKRIFVHSTHLPANDKTMSFQQIWQPLVKLLGGQVLEHMPEEPSSLDIMVTDNSATPEERQKAEQAGAAIVSSEWLIQGIIMSAMPAFDAHPRFSFDGGNPVPPAIQTSTSQ